MAATMVHRETPVLINRLSRLLGERRMTVKELADRTGISYRAVLDLYHARSTRVDLETINRICNVLRVTPNDLFEHHPDGEREERAC